MLLSWGKCEGGRDPLLDNSVSGLMWVGQSVSACLAQGRVCPR